MNARLWKGEEMRLFLSRLVTTGPLALLIAIVAMLVGAVAGNYPALLSGQIVDHVTKGDIRSFNAALPFLAALLGSYVVREIAAVIRKFVVERAACDIERDELRRLSSFLLRLDLSEFLAHRIGALNVRIHRSLEGLVSLLKLLFMSLLPTLMLSGVALVMVAQKNLVILAIMLIVFALASGLTVAQVMTQKGIRIALFKAKEDVSANLTEVLLGLEYVRAMGATGQEEERTYALSGRLRDQEFKHHKWMMGFDSAKQILEGTGLVLVIAFGAWRMAEGAISSGDVLTFALLYGSVAAPLRDLHRIVDEGFENLMKVRELAGLYRQVLDIGIPGFIPIPEPAANRPTITARQLSLTVAGPHGEQERLIRGVDLEIMPGEWVGVAGRSGCGKSTLLKLVLGITPNYSGELQVLGVEVRESEKAALWRRVGYVGQKPHLIKGSLRDNLLYGSVGERCDDEDLLEAVEMAGLSDRFSHRGLACLDDEIQEQGRGLGGGEQQRLSIARLFLRRPSIIILDEATSALDYENEWKLIQRLRKEFKLATALVVAHRLEALKETDRILVMRNGEIVESGSFDDLRRRGGEFNLITNLPKGLALT